MASIAFLPATEPLHFKDAILDHVARRANVAQFVSFSPDLTQRYCRVFGLGPNHRFPSVGDAIERVLALSTDGSVNVRSFEPENPKSREFVYGLRSVDDVCRVLHRLATSGLHTIVNETIDVEDGGVSGVALGSAIEFAPGDTPRAVEKPGTAALPRVLGLRLLQAVYGFEPALGFPPSFRVEFSVHPIRRGFQRAHTIIWELEKVTAPSIRPEVVWPNNFSRFIGDKTFGLLIAHLLGAPVPQTTVICRNVAPFGFGRATGCDEPWLRTCPIVQMPGRFTTRRGWTDPFELLEAEDPEGTDIVSVLAQAGIDALYSGALVAGPGQGTRRELLIEGTAGFGDDFMVGLKKRTRLPLAVTSAVRKVYDHLAERLGPVRFEWVADKTRVWVVQLHRGATESTGRTIYPGKPSEFVRFRVENGLEALRALIAGFNGRSRGVVLVGDVGVTSHFGDLLRKAKIPSRVEPA